MIDQKLSSLDGKLRRELSAQQLTFISLGSIIGSGWLFAVLAAGSVAGPAVIISWVIGAVLIIALALNYAEIGSMLPRTGGVIRYPYLTHGRFFGFMSSWALILGGVTAVSIEALGVVQYGAKYAERWFGLQLLSTGDGGTRLTPVGIASATALMLLFFLLNILGVRFFGRFNQWVTWWKLIIPTCTFLLLFFTFHGSNFAAHGGFAPNGSGAVLNAVAVSGIIFAFQGFREGINFSGESRNPQRDVVIATVGSVVIATVIYIMLQIAFIGAINWHKMGLTPGSWSRMESSSWASQPLYSALDSSGIALLGSFAVLLLIDAAISPAGAGWIYMGDTARGAYGMALHGSLPKVFTRIGARSRVPVVGMVACLVLGCAFFMPFPGWYQLIGYTSATASLTYLTGGPQLRVLRRTAGHLNRPFVLRGSLLWSPLAFLAAGMVVYWSGFNVLRGVVASFLVGLTLYASLQGPSQQRISKRAGVTIGAGFLVAWGVLQVLGPLGKSALPFPLFWLLCTVMVCTALAALWLFMDDAGKREIIAGAWAPGLVLALYLLSYYGAYGPGSPAAIKFPYDTVIATAVCLAGYAWSVRVGYRTPDLEAIEEMQPLPEEPMEAQPTGVQAQG